MKINKPLAATLLIGISAFIWSCQKEFSSETISNNYNKERIAQKFFGGVTSDPSVMRVKNKLEEMNKNFEFVSDFAGKAGYPVWDKVLKGKGKTIAEQFSANVNNGDTIIIIPVVLENTEYINAFIKAVLSDTTIILTYGLKANYIDYPFTNSNTSTTGDKAEQYCLKFLVLERLVFGEEQFKLLDKRLFYRPGSDTTEHTKIEVKLADSSGNFQATFCTYIWVTWICYCGNPNCEVNPAFQTSVPLCFSFEDLGGGGVGGGYTFPSGGSGGSGSTTNSGTTGTTTMNTGNIGWTAVLDQEPVHPVKDSIPGILSRACDTQADSVFNWGLQNNNREQSFILVRRNGVIYAKNFTPGAENGASTRVNYILAPDEELVGYFHTHPEETPPQRSFFSDTDIMTARKNANIPGYCAILECGNKRYALVIEDPVKLNAFMGGTFEGSVRNFLLRQRALEYVYTPRQSNFYTNGQQASVNAVVQFFGSASVSGIGFYEATAPNKNNFTKLNP